VIRRDYILRMIEEFVRALARLRELRQAGQHEAAGALLDERFQTLVGTGAEAVGTLSETELLARLLEGEPTQVVRDKSLLLVALLREAAELHAARGREDQGRVCDLKALHLLLEVLLHEGATSLPDFVPRLDMLLAGLCGQPLPPRTCAALMRHYELIGEYAKAEDALFALLENEPKNPALIELGLAFYERLRRQSDAALCAGNLPRAEAEASLSELRARRAAPTGFLGG